jgi:uncharacterized protein DUF4440
MTPSTKKYLVSLGLAFGCGGVFTHAVQDMMDEIRSAEAAWMSARLTGNRAAYAELLANDFTWTYTTGRVLNRQQSIAALQPRPAPALERTVHAYQHCAVVAGNATLTLEGKPVHERFVRVWSKEREGWRAVHFQATEVEPAGRD